MNNFIRSTSLINECAMRQTANRLQIHGGVKKQAEIISTVSEELCEYLGQFKRKHITREQVKDFYRELFPKLNIEIYCCRPKIGHALVHSPENKGDPIIMAIHSESFLDDIKSDTQKDENPNRFYVNSDFVYTFVHENVHVMQLYMKSAVRMYNESIKTLVKDSQVITEEHNVDYWCKKFRDIADKARLKKVDNADGNAPIGPEEFIEELKKALKFKTSTEDILRLNLKYCIRGAEMEEQAYKEGYLNSLRFIFPKLSKYPFFNKLFGKLSSSLTDSLGYRRKIDIMKQEYYKMLEAERLKISDAGETKQN